jgi:NitT/TauT family transport system ATP-binding protein
LDIRSKGSAQDRQAVLSARGIGVVYGKGASAKTAVADISFEVHPGEFVCIVGPSGAGKTTLLRCIAGLQIPTTGEVFFEGAKVTRPPERMAVVFQDYGRSLFPWMTVWQNVDFPLSSAKKLSKTQREQVVADALASVGLAKFDSAYPWQLSGGMQQRVAIARALAFGSDLLLMDEPFASLDAQTRAELEDLTRRINAERDVTVVFITHDIDEAVYLSDKVVVLSKPPSRVEAEYSVALPKPRHQVKTKELPEYLRLRAEIMSRIQGNTLEHDSHTSETPVLVGNSQE